MGIVVSIGFWLFLIAVLALLTVPSMLVDKSIPVEDLKLTLYGENGSDPRYLIVPASEYQGDEWFVIEFSAPTTGLMISSLHT